MLHKPQFYLILSLGLGLLGVACGSGAEGEGFDYVGSLGPEVPDPAGIPDLDPTDPDPGAPFAPPSFEYPPGGFDLADPNPLEPDSEPVEATMYVEGRHLYDRCGNPVVLRGVNHMNYWTDKDGSDFPEIAQSGANSVRIVFQIGGSPGELRALIRAAIEAGMLPMVELHDATGNFSGLPALVDFWVRPAVVAVLKHYEGSLLVNIGNEVGDYSVTAEQWIAGYTDAITRMRAAGIDAPLIIDSRGWARDAEFLIENAPALIAQDPLGNLMFSHHVYDVGTPVGHYDTLFAAAVQADIAFIIGEFAQEGVGCAGAVNYGELIKAAEDQDIGWYAWSWGPGNTPCADMDMSSDGTFAGLHGWGDVVAVTSPYSISNTSEPVASLDGSCE